VSFSWLVVVLAAEREDEVEMARAFPVKMPSGVRYWTVLDGELAVVGPADAFLRHVRFGRDGAELTTKAYAGGIALFLRWCRRTGRDWLSGVEQLGLFIVWLRYAGPQVSGLDAQMGGGEVLSGPGVDPARRERRINAVLAAVRGLVVHTVTAGDAPARLLPLLYELADDRDLPAVARDGDGRLSWRMRARHRLSEPDEPVDRATDEEIVALLRACCSARDRLFREPIGAPMPPDAVNDLVAAACRRAGLSRLVTPHQMRHAFASNLVDAGGSVDELQELLGHASMTSSEVYLHPDPSRLRAAVDRVPTPREQSGTAR
jgi:hypothetical protein